MGSCGFWRSATRSIDGPIPGEDASQAKTRARCWSRVRAPAPVEDVQRDASELLAALAALRVNDHEFVDWAEEHAA